MTISTKNMILFIVGETFELDFEPKKYYIGSNNQEILNEIKKDLINKFNLEIEDLQEHINSTFITDENIKQHSEDIIDYKVIINQIEKSKTFNELNDFIRIVPHSNSCNIYLYIVFDEIVKCVGDL